MIHELIDAYFVRIYCFGYRKIVDMVFHCHFFASLARGFVIKLNVMVASSLTSSTRELEKRLEPKYGVEIKWCMITQKWNVTNFLV